MNIVTILSKKQNELYRQTKQYHATPTVQRYSPLLGIAGVCILLLFLLPSCKKELSQINTNPNAPISAQPDLLLRQVLYDFGENNSYEGFVAGNVLGQYFTMVDFNLFDRHDLSSPQYGGKPWSYHYNNLRDNATILKQARENAVFKVYEGPALIMKAYMTAALTDLYGDVPYTDALKGKDGNVTPAYTSQEAIYTSSDGILDNLNKGIASIKAYTGTQTLKGDILYNGNLTNWVKFANSLKIKYLMRISDKMDVSMELQSIFMTGEYQKTNAENAVFSFTAGPPNSFRMNTLRIGDFSLFILSQTAEEILKSNNDPRLNVFFRPTAAMPTEYRGLLNGQNASTNSITVANYSLAGNIFRENTGQLKANFMTAWETSFLLAEAAERGLLASSAKTLYDEGVTAAFSYWQTNMPANYLTSGPVAYGVNLADKIGQIITQKWTANIINGYEGWIEYRRTGYPALKPIAASLNNNLIPVRLPYPIEEAALNSINYSTAASATNGNSVNAKVWWDVK